MKDSPQQNPGNIPGIEAGAEQPGISFFLIMLFWTLLIVALAIWNYYQNHRAVLHEAQIAARYSFGKDLTFRRWATAHGGVYVPVTEETPPNPYLSHVPERDIVTPSGRQLTLVNPAYMIRQVHGMTDELFGARGHITSLRPNRPENVADEWETVALQAFERGAVEWSNLAPVAGEAHLRLMRPLPAEAGCLKCHARQGYQVGDIIGGISVSIPWAPYRQALQVSALGLAAGYGSIWLLGLLFIERSRRRLRSHLAIRRQAEHALRLRSKELEERTAELERFTYTVSHDLKSPVVTIKSFLGFLEQDLAAGEVEQIPKDIDHIRLATDKMGQLLDELLELSRIGRRVNPPTAVSFQDLVRDALSLTAGAVADLRVEVQVEAAELTLYGDRSRLVEIWQNLVDNAVKFMGDQESPRLQIGVESAAERPVFFVRDNGIGIDPPFQEKIFGLFERLDTGVKGTGIGLALVKRIVELYEGEIWVESAGPGQGACFRFTLPNAIREPE